MIYLFTVNSNIPNVNVTQESVVTERLNIQTCEGRAVSHRSDNYIFARKIHAGFYYPRKNTTCSIAGRNNGGLDTRLQFQQRVCCNYTRRVTFRHRIILAARVEEKGGKTCGESGEPGTIRRGDQICTFSSRIFSRCRTCRGIRVTIAQSRRWQIRDGKK